MGNKSPNWFNIVMSVVGSVLVGLIASAIHWVVGVILFFVALYFLATKIQAPWFDDGGPS